MTAPLFLSVEKFQSLLTNEPAYLFYFSTESCDVGEALEPKIKNLLTEKFPKIVFQSIDLNFSPEISAYYNVFAEPTVLVFFEGKESIRKSRGISVVELEQAIDRLYKLIFYE